MKVAFFDHRGTGTSFAAALCAAGHDLVEDHGDALLIDHDLPYGIYGARCDAHERVLLYPHGAGLVASGDGQHPVHPHTVARFEHGPGQAEVLRRCGYPRPVHVVGWPLCPLRPFRPRGEIRRVLLAPQHDSGAGWVDARLRAQNAAIHDALAGLEGVTLTVRWVGSFPALGIRPRVGVRYVQGDGTLAGAVTTIDAVDCVVGSAWTLPTLAVARGVPTVMYGMLRPDDDWTERLQHRHPALTWEAYREYVRFPLDASEASTPGALRWLLERAGAGDPAVNDWRWRFVGEAFDPAVFVALVERYGGAA